MGLSEIIWPVLALVALNSVSMLVSALITGYLVFRSKREQHERLFPKEIKRDRKPIVKDDFLFEEKEEEAVPEIIRKMNRRCMEDTAISSLKAVNASSRVNND